jgi:hypothetical protein
MSPQGQNPKQRFDTIEEQFARFERMEAKLRKEARVERAKQLGLPPLQEIDRLARVGSRARTPRSAHRSDG